MNNVIYSRFALQKAFLRRLALSLGLAIAGLGQFAMVWSASGVLVTEEFSVFVVFIALTGIPAFLIASPVHFLFLINMSGKSAGSGSSERAEIGSAISLTVIYVLLTSTYVALGNNFPSEKLKIIAVLLIAINGAVQVHSGFQRGMLATEDRWVLIGLQLGVEGLIRVLVSLFLSLGILSSLSMFMVSFTVPGAISVSLVYRFIKPSQKMRITATKMRFNYSQFIPFWISAVGLHMMVTIAPVLMQIKGSKASDIGIMGIALFVVRVPITLAGAFVTPMVKSFVNAKSSGDRDFEKIFRIVSVTFLIATLITFVGLFIPKNLIFALFREDTVSLKAVLIISIALSGALLMVIELQAYLVAHSRLKIVSLGWFMGIMMYISTQILSVDLMHALLSMMCGTLTVFTIFTVSIVLANNESRT